MEPPRADEDRRLPPWSVAASLAVHVLLGAALLLTSPSRAAPPPPESYRVQLVAVAAEEAPEREEPRPAEPDEEEHRPPPPEPTTEPKPETERPTTEEEVEEVPEPEEEPAEAPEEGEEAVNVQLDGATFPFPEYLDNIIRQINRHWRKPTGGRHLQAELSFVIHGDGSVSGIEWVQRSGNRSFDLEARGAVEAAGARGAFGPLPERYPRDRLRVSFFFDPSTR